MDGESSYESDISESWSLIDINLNEESCSETPSNVDSIHLQDLSKLREERKEDFVEKNEKTNTTDLSLVNDSDCYNNEEQATCSNTGLTEVNPLCKKNSKIQSSNDSDDTESIEILDVDENFRDSELDKLDISFIGHQDTYQSDDEESLEGNVNNESRSKSSTVIKRKRRKFSRNSEGDVHSVNSDNRSPKKCDSKAFLSEATEKSESLLVETYKPSGHSVYKHYRNNVVNTTLSLSVGVIFAGVACIAIGHFLGIQDAADTAVELMETLKKLQIENAALQSRLFHLNRALLTRETNPKLQLLENEETKVSYRSPLQMDSIKMEGENLNRATLSEIRSSLYFMNWLSKIQNVIRNENNEYEKGIDLNRFGKYPTTKQLNFIKSRKEIKPNSESKLDENPKKISKALQKLSHRLSFYQDNLEKQYQRLMGIWETLNHMLNKVNPEILDTNENLKVKGRFPVTERDMHLMQVNVGRNVRNDSVQKYPENIVSYQFPQREEYYLTDKNVKKGEEIKFSEKTNSTKSMKYDFISKEKEKHKKIYKNEKKRHKKKGKNKWEKGKPRKCDFREENKDKKRKQVLKNIERSNKRKEKTFESGPLNHAFSSVLNETNALKTKYSKVEDLKGKRKIKKPKRGWLSKLKKESNEKKSRNGWCSKNQCFNSTGYWVFKLAGGREEQRRYQALSDWQFDRAVGRKEQRDDTISDWQFDRAKGRKEQRDDENGISWQFKRALARDNKRKDSRWRREKYTKYNAKEFFHERFSWI